jgi:hypothetical protein
MAELPVLTGRYTIVDTITQYGKYYQAGSHKISRSIWNLIEFESSNDAADRYLRDVLGLHTTIKGCWEQKDSAHTPLQDSLCNMALRLLPDALRRTVLKAQRRHTVACCLHLWTHVVFCLPL